MNEPHTFMPGSFQTSLGLDLSPDGMYSKRLSAWQHFHFLVCFRKGVAGSNECSAISQINKASLYNVHISMLIQ